MSYRSVKQKLFIEQLLMAPFVWLGKLYGTLFPLQTKHGAVLFFSNADIGGAPQVNIDITACIKDKKPLIIFSKYPRNNQFRDRFAIEGARIIDLHKKIDNKLRSVFDALSQPKPRRLNRKLIFAIFILLEQ